MLVVTLHRQGLIDFEESIGKSLFGTEIRCLLYNHDRSITVFLIQCVLYGRFHSQYRINISAQIKSVLSRLATVQQKNVLTVHIFKCSVSRVS